MVWIIVIAAMVAVSICILRVLLIGERCAKSETVLVEDSRAKALREFAEWGDRKYLSDHVYQVTWWDGKEYREVNGLPRNVSSKGELVLLDVDDPSFCAVSVPLHEIIFITRKGS